MEVIFMATKKETLQAVEEKVEETQAVEEKVKVFIPKNRNIKNDDSEIIYVNDRSFQVKKGEWVEVPICVAEVLSNRDKALDRADAFITENLV